jgi:hypothetical protein
MTVGCSCGAMQAEESKEGPFNWVPEYRSTCHINGKDYRCRVIADGQEFYEQILYDGQLDDSNFAVQSDPWHYSLIGESYSCGNAAELAICGNLKMARPADSRDKTFSFKQTSRGWRLTSKYDKTRGIDYIENSFTPIPRTKEEPTCSYNGIKEPCVLLPIFEGSEMSTIFKKGYAFQVIYIKDNRRKESYKSVVYQAIGPAKTCEATGSCLTGKMLIQDNNGGSWHETKATYRVTKQQWRIYSALGNTLMIDFP